jgi:hypothetical protein
MIKNEDLEIKKVVSAGNEKTFLMQINWLLHQNYAEKVFFAEDDYLYRPKMFAQMLQVLDNQSTPVHFVAPHNHGDYYHSVLQHAAGTRLIFEQERHWHAPVSACLTFLTTRRVLTETCNIFRTYKNGNSDFAIFTALVRPSLFLFPPKSLWRNLFFIKNLVKAHWMTWRQLYFGRRYNLVVPIDAVATHMQFDELGPGVDWAKLIMEYQQHLAH